MKLYLIDAYALIFRAYYAFIRAPRINSKGINTSAIMGFFNTLEEVINEGQPTHIGVAFDPAGGSFRSQIYPLYKAQREETPEAIRQRLEQVGIVFEGRSTQEVFNDIYSHLCTGASSREDALADKALSQTFSELFESELVDEQGLDVFKPELLEFMVSHFVANSIYYKLLNEVSFGELTGDKSNSDIAKIEEELKTFIDGFVSGRVPDHLHEGITPGEVNKLVDNLYEDCYKVMEGLAE